MQPEFISAFIRYPRGIPVRYRACANGVNGHASLTPGGICFPTGEALRAGTLVQVALPTPRGEEHLTVKVAWSRPEDGVYLTGACLLDHADACRARLAAQLCLIDAYRRSQQARGRELDEDTAAGEWIARYAHQVPAIT